MPVADNLVTKDPTNWEVTGYAGKLTYQVDGTMLCVVLNAGGITPDNWYLIELNDKNKAIWTVISPDNYSSLYAQANGGGNIHADFSCAVETGMAVEVNVKNAVSLKTGSLLLCRKHWANRQHMEFQRNGYWALNRVGTTYYIVRIRFLFLSSKYMECIWVKL
ncbi:hypothetical protein ACFLXC_06170 [Chloroflexota bacterium]